MNSCPGCSDQPQPPDSVVYRNPADNATNVFRDPLLSWDEAVYALNYDVYLGKVENDVANATRDSSSEYKGNRTVTNYPAENLDYQTKYYWRIDSINDVGFNTGPVWSFTTLALPIYSWVDQSLASVPESFYGSWFGSVYAVGAWGIIYSYNGATWDEITSPTNNNLMAIWAADANNVFAVGGFGLPDNNGTIVQYDGTDWTAIVEADSETYPWLRDVHGVSATNVFAVGYEGTILNYDGTDWNPMSSDAIYELFGVWCHSETDVFAVGADGMILHFDGTDWSTMTSGTTIAFRAVWGASATDVFAVGDSGTIMHYDGTDWTAAAGIPPYDFMDVWGSSSSDVFVVGEMGKIYHFDGTDWASMTTPVDVWLESICGSTTTTDIYVFGQSGTILHYGE